MQQKERHDYTPPAGGGNGNSGGGLDAVREQANRFLAAGDEAINHALAQSDSRMFIRVNRQHGGE